MASPSTGAVGATAPRRTARPRYKDPRLLFGIVLILTSVLLGIRLVSAFDQSVEYWSLSQDVVAGQVVESDHLVVMRAQLDDDSNYLRVDDELPRSIDGSEWAAAASAGTLIDAGAWRERGTGLTAEVPIEVAAGGAPHDLAVGDSIDVWSADSTGVEEAAQRVLSDVRVISLSDPAEALSGIGRTIVVALYETELTGEALAGLVRGEVIVVRRP